MIAPFPFQYPAATAFYLALYVLTFVVHQVFMHYVLAGSIYVAWATLSPGRNSQPRTEQPLAATLRDWMPFLLSAAITAGIAPLLFIQIIYQLQFYTANLLLWWRWMLVVPVLIIAFYLLYLVKSSMLWRWPYPVQLLVAVGTSLCFVFVGFCWTANHLLASSGAAWPEVYATGQLPLFASIVIPRMLIWIGGSYTTMTVIVGWQLLFRKQIVIDHAIYPDKTSDPSDQSVQQLALMSWAGMSVALLAGLVYFVQLDRDTRGVILSLSFAPYVLLLLAGVALQVFGWYQQLAAKNLASRGMILASTGCGLTLLGVAVVREGIRVRAIDLTQLATRHTDATQMGGFGVFVVAAIVVSIVIGWCIRLVQSGMVTPGDST